MDIFQQAQQKTNIYTIRTIALFGGMTHWTWYFFYLQNFKDIQDLLWPRVLLSFLSLAVFLYSFRPNSYQRTINSYNVGLLIFFFYESFLYLYNHGDQHFAFSLFGMGVLTMSASMSLIVSIIISVLTILTPAFGYFIGVGLEPLTVFHWTIACPPIFLVVGFLLVRNEKHKKEVTDLHLKYVEISKNSALGEMSSGMAHEINNPLTIISGRLNLLLYKMNSKSEKMDLNKCEQDLVAMKSAAQKIERVIKSLRLYTEKLGMKTKEILLLTAIFEHSLDMCTERLKNEGVDFRMDLPENIYIFGNQALLAQVFLSLILNSVEALEQSSFKLIRISAQVVDKGLMLQFLDSGPRIPDEIRKKMMSPFFTTKDPSKVSGLGLSTSQSIIESHGGEMQLNESDETCFQIILPIAPTKVGAILKTK